MLITLQHAAPQLWNKPPHSFHAPYVPHCSIYCHALMPALLSTYLMAPTVSPSLFLLRISLSLFRTDHTKLSLFVFKSLVTVTYPSAAD